MAAALNLVIPVPIWLIVVIVSVITAALQIWGSYTLIPPSEVKAFAVAIAVCTVVAMCLNFIGLNPMKALVWASVVQGLSTPLLMLLIMRITTSRKVMGQWVNTRPLNLLGWITTAAIFAASLGLLVTWLK